jgi:hypothetical protein
MDGALSRRPVLVHPSLTLEYSCSDVVFASQNPARGCRVPAADKATLLPKTGVDLGIQGQGSQIGARCLTMKSE